MSIGRLLILLLVGLAVGAGNAYLVHEGFPLQEPKFLSALAGGPVVVALLGIILGSGRRTAAADTATTESEPAAEVEPAAPSDPPEASALRLLAALQEDGRFVDFLTEEVEPYPDDQIGAATRGIHKSLRKALSDCVTLEPVLAGSEGDSVTVPAGFDPSEIRLVGNVSGTPPFVGVLRHTGWRVTKVAVPERRGQDDRVVAPAEVEIG